MAAKKYEYQFSAYSFQTSERAASAQLSMATMAEAGWRIHTASMSFVEMSVLWEREVS